MPPATPLSIVTGRIDEGPGADLIAAFVSELEQMYEPGFVSRSPSATQRDFQPPGGTFLVAFDGDEPIACGGLKRLCEEVVEIKRMYVVPEARRRGVARTLLAALEEAARSLGYRRVRLDTGRHQPHAITLYESAGYRAIPDYNDNPYASYWAEKVL